MDERVFDPIKENRMLAEIERSVTFYLGAVEVLDHEPRAADFWTALPPLKKRALTLSQELYSLDFRIKTELRDHGADVSSLSDLLRSFADDVDATLEGKDSTESRGPPTKKALLVVIGKLRRTFHRYYVGGDLGEDKASKFTIRGETEGLTLGQSDEREFVALALDDANIPYPSDIRRLFNEPEAARLEDRHKVIKNIANKLKKTRN